MHQPRDDRERSASARPIHYPGRVPPHDIEAERAVLGSILLSNEAIYSAIEQLQPEDFYKPSHQLIYKAMIELATKSEPVDSITLQAALKAKDELEAAGGLGTIAEIAETVPTAANVKHYAEIVRNKSTLRRLIGAATEIAGNAFEGGTADEVLDRAERAVFEISMVKSRKGITPVRDIVKEAFRRIEQLYEQKKEITGVPSGFIEIDKMTAGLQPSDLIIVAGRPSMGKCLAADTEIVLQDGSVETIEEIVRRKDAQLLTLGDRFKLELTSPSAYVDDGTKPVFRVCTRLGRVVETTLTHPFLTIDGWRPLAELTIGARVAVPRVVPVFGEATMKEHEVKLLGYLLGDGCLRGSSITFTNSNPRILADFEASLHAWGLQGERVERTDRAPTVRVKENLAATRLARRAFSRRFTSALGVSPAAVTHWAQGKTSPAPEMIPLISRELAVDASELTGGEPIWTNGANALARWLEELGLRGEDAHGKSVPRVIFTLRRELIALFLNRLFATDGWAACLESGQAQLGYCSVSERLARQVQHLLVRFGIIATLKKKRVKYGGSERHAWQLDITDRASILRFGEEIDIFGKEEALDRALAAARSRRPQTNRDLVPREIWRRISSLKGSEPWSSLAKRAGLAGTSNIHARKRALTRGRLASLALALGDQNLADIAASDVYWDEIVSIEPVGKKRVFDLTIGRTHNFVANDVCVHNTSFAINMGTHAAIRDNAPVAVFSLEMSKEQLVMRMLCSEGRIDLARMRGGFLEESDWPKLAKAAGVLSDAPIYIDDTGSISVLEVRAKCRRLAAESKLGLVIIDYLQLMRGSPNAQSREQEISEISRGLKSLAKELHVPVIALSQLNRSLEQRADKRPVLSDLRESGAIEQDADVIMFVYRDEVYDPKEENRGVAEIIIGKQRNGPIGTARVKFFHGYTRFDNLVED
jgi:replicative DNA helicase